MAGNVDVLRYLLEGGVDFEAVDAALAQAEKEERTAMVAPFNARSSMMSQYLGIGSGSSGL